MWKTLPSAAEADLAGVLVTYERHRELSHYLDRLASQTLRPGVLVVVDNGTGDGGRMIVTSHPLFEEIDVLFVQPGSNLGPAGGINAGLYALRGHPSAPAYVVLLDDDDPPVADHLIEQLVARLTASSQSTAGVSLRGGVLNTRTGLIRRAQAPSGVAKADHLHGGYLPVYRRKALQSVRGFDSSLFWGFEELDLGTRLTRNGWDLVVDCTLMKQIAHLYPKHKSERRSLLTLADRSWRHYYRHRNHLHVLRAQRLWTALFFNITIRLIAKPILAAPMGPRLAYWHLRTNWAAILDGAGRRNVTNDHNRYHPL